MLQDVLKQFESGNNLSEDMAEECFDALLKETDEALLANVLLAWNRKGTTEDELFALARIMRERCRKVESKHEQFIDIVGTGGSKVKTFNVSTATAFVVAGAGVPVAKHGNRAASSNSGSADVLTELGINATVDPVVAEKCLNDIGICFMYAPNHHSLSPTLANVRRGLGEPTIFNILGPLCNPANAPIQLVGVSDRNLVEKAAKVLARLGSHCAWVVHGSDGLDEVTLNGITHVAEVEEGSFLEPSFTIEPDDVFFDDIGRRDIKHLRVSSANESAAVIRSILDEKCDDKTAVDLVLINAAVAIHLAIPNVATCLVDAYVIAKVSLESGAALKKLKELRKATTA